MTPEEFKDKFVDLLNSFPPEDFKFLMSWVVVSEWMDEEGNWMLRRIVAKDIPHWRAYGMLTTAADEWEDDE